MNNVYSISVLMIFSMVLCGYAQNQNEVQRSQIAFFAASSFAQITGDVAQRLERNTQEQNDLLGEDYRFSIDVPNRLGYGFGINYSYGFSQSIKFTSGLGFSFFPLSTQVTYQYNDPEFSYDELGFDETTFNFYYVSVPLLIGFQVTPRWNIEGGVNFNIALKGLAQATSETKRDIFINGEIDSEWSIPLTKNSIDIKDEINSVVLQYKISLGYKISDMFNVHLGLFQNLNHITVDNENMNSRGVQLSLRGNLNNLF